MTSELTIEESKALALKRIEPGYDSIYMANFLESEVDPDDLIEHLATVEGVNQIHKLSISYSSYLKDLKIIKAFPNLHYIHVFGYKIASLDGLEWFQKGQYIEICTEKNRRRNIEGIARAPINRMSLQYARPEDLDAIAKCPTLKSFELSQSKDIDFSKWKLSNLETLALKQGKFNVLGDTSEVPCLNDMSVLGCRGLERFVGDNSQIKRMLISSCKRLDLRTIRTFTGIERFTVNGNDQVMGLSEIGELKHLKSMNLLNCKVTVDLIDLRSQFPQLEKIFIDSMKKNQILELREANPGIAVQETIS